MLSNCISSIKEYLQPIHCPSVNQLAIALPKQYSIAENNHNASLDGKFGLQECLPVSRRFHGGLLPTPYLHGINCGALDFGRGHIVVVVIDDNQ
ncbi:hypothetical protein Ancab_005725 [Ancistrocladus abbreviatus]